MPGSLPPDPAFDSILATAVRRVLLGEPLQPFCDWFARDMGDLVMSQHPVAPADEEAARRYQRSVARTLWAALPVPFNRWRPRALPKVERNDPCHCGSGRKFKHCCAEFAGLSLPFEPESLYALALAQAEPATLTPDNIRLVPPAALGMAAMDWNDDDQPERTVAVLVPLFQQRDDLDERHEAAFDALMDALHAQGKETQRWALVQRVGQSRAPALATAARCRQASMLADRGDFDAAWAMFQSAQRLSPGDPQLLHLEMTLLLAQGRNEEAKLRAPLLAAKARKSGWDDLAALLPQLAEGGFAAAFQQGDAGDMDDPADLEWVALCELAPREFASHDCRALYRVVESPPEQAGRPPILSIKPQKALVDLQRRWSRRFPVSKPMLTQLTGDADLLLADLPAATQFLRENPQAWLSADVLDDLLLAAAEICDRDAPGPIVRAALRLSQHALAVLQALAGPAEGSVSAELHWADSAARPLLRVLAQAIELARLTQDAKEEERLVRWGLALNPNDNHGWRGLLAPLYLARKAFDETLALLERYPDDMPPAEHSRALALFGLGRRDEAQAVLRRAHAEYPAILSALWPETLDLPEDEGGPGLAIGGALAAFYYRIETRAAWAGTGALAWSKTLDLPQPAPKKTRKPQAGGKRTSRSPAVSDPLGGKQGAHLRKAFPDYPRLHGLLTAIGWSPDLIMPGKWVQIVMDMRGEPVSGLTESKALKAVNADMDALMGLLNSINARVLETPPDQMAPAQDVLALAASEAALFAWAAGFVQGAELAPAGWRRAGRPVSSDKGTFGELYALAARASGTPDAWRATRDGGQPLLTGLDDSPPVPVETLVLVLGDLWRVVAPLRQA
ncbi:UPF0149 family protein [Ramlibacter sp. WS9]|uniref:UPF0149 family protein n=1 Tax=Ramlibacter sp. WS9 TaxID=1882741 RepID=UPI00114354B5|nr:UPF0149 family protein [Ramlibacter sp. WS9]ROZ76030.1 YecA family protein [Ramlibacter sp. WS9]